MSNQIRTNTDLTFTSSVRFDRGHKGALRLAVGEGRKPAPSGRVPRVARLMAPAVRFEHLLRTGQVKDYAELARLGHVTRARVTQVMNLLMLAPDIMEQILFLPPVQAGRDPIKEWEVRPIAAEPLWPRQRKLWLKLLRSRPGISLTRR